MMKNSSEIRSDHQGQFKSSQSPAQQSGLIQPPSLSMLKGGGATQGVYQVTNSKPGSPQGIKERVRFAIRQWKYGIWASASNSEHSNALNNLSQADRNKYSNGSPKSKSDLAAIANKYETTNVLKHGERKLADFLRTERNAVKVMGTASSLDIEIENMNAKFCQGCTRALFLELFKWQKDFPGIEISVVVNFQHELKDGSSRAGKYKLFNSFIVSGAQYAPAVTTEAIRNHLGGKYGERGYKQFNWLTDLDLTTNPISFQAVDLG